MRLLVDECTGPKVAEWLRNEGHDVFSVYQEATGMSDADVLAKAVHEDWVLITNDKDFGEMVFRERLAHKGVIFLRLADERASNKIDVLRKLFANHSEKLQGQFVTVTDTKVRFARA